MRKKTKSKLSNSLEVKSHAAHFWIIILLLFICAVFHSILFYKSFFGGLLKLNEEPIATITFKYKTAQRKFLARNVWDRLSQNSPVYNGDTIHTGALSEATIYFNDGNVMTLGENTMAQLFFNENNELSAQLDGGSAMFDTSGSQNGITVKSGGVQLQVESGSNLSANLEQASGGALGAFFQMLAGNARVVSEGEQKDLGEGQSVSVDGANQIGEPNISVLNPPPNHKLLYHNEGSLVVDFNWKVANAPTQRTPAFIVVATDKKFANVVQQKEIDLAGLGFCQLELAPQTYYWKIEGVSGAVPSGKLQVVQSLPPRLIAPVLDYVYSYKDKSPAVRLIWSEAPSATSYLLEIADNADFRNPVVEQRSSSASYTVSTLSSGKYYWRVSPYYTIGNQGYAATSETGFFTVEKKNEMRAPRLLAPLDGAVVNTDSGAVSFSWKSDADAENYTLLISSNENLSAPFVSQTVKENYFKVQNLSKLAPDGKWYWGVTSRDAAGNASPVSEVRTVYGMKGQFEQHTIEPVNGYKIGQNLLADMRFTWKKNIPESFESWLEISTDSNFKNIVVSQKTYGTSAFVKRLDVGTYYWRLKSAGGGMSMETPPKVLNVTSNLPAPSITEPQDICLVQGAMPVDFKWNAVQDAHYYKIEVASEDGKVLYNETVYENQISFNLPEDNFKDRASYKVQVQAFAFDVPGVSSRRTGDLAVKDFTLRKLRPVQIEYPTEGMVIDGAQAIMNPITARWSCAESLSEARFVLTKIDGEKPVEVLHYPSDNAVMQGQKIAPNKILLDTKDGLRPGKYRIVVYATTTDGIDISNSLPRLARTFTISPIPLLDAPKKLAATPQEFDEKYLQQKSAKRAVALEWGKVPNATEYQLAIFKDEQLVLQKALDQNSYEIDFMALDQDERLLFARGEFTWQVQALRRVDTDGDGVLDKIFQEGEVETGTFTTNVPLPKGAQVKGAVNPYAQ